MKKLLLGLSSLVSIAAPVATVVACNKDPKPEAGTEDGANKEEFSFATEFSKIAKLTSSKSIKDINKAVKGKAKGAVLSTDDLGITLDDITEGVTAEITFEKVGDITTASIEVKVILKKGEETSEAKKVIIEALDKIDFTDALAIIEDKVSTKDISTLTTDLQGTVKTKVTYGALGIEPFTELPTVSGTPVTIEEKILVEAFDASSGEAKVKVTLSHGDQLVSKEIIVKATDAPDAA